MFVIRYLINETTREDLLKYELLVKEDLSVTGSELEVLPRKVWEQNLVRNIGQS